MSDEFPRVTPQLLDVLAALLNAPDHEAHGWSVARVAKIGGPSAYRILDRCKDRGLATSRWDETEPGKPPRRLYKLTEDGAERVRALLKERGRT